ncbi:hypothetical protein M3Y99_00890500 [Aphelenchoides fujianensis]|nr:hypothetical protein M3Y99_00890500 [Aphelenchoides fujianensis]
MGEFLIGLIQCLISTVLFGSSFVPIKNYEFGDGIFSLQIRSTTILVFGFGAFLWTGQSHFYAFAMLGGSIWTVACLIILPCIGELGLGVAVLVYSFMNCVTQWVTGNFGLFWTNARPPPPENMWINYIGLVGLLVGGGLIAFVKAERPQPKLSTVSTISTVQVLPQKPKNLAEEFTFAHKGAYYGMTGYRLRNLNGRRIFAFAAALFAGFLFGEDVTPLIIMQDNPAVWPNAPTNNENFIFSYYVGIFLTTSLVFAGYCVVKKNRPFVNNELALPSMVSGVMWSVAQGLFIICTHHLSVSVSGPISAICPSVVASCWSVFYFHEIQGRRNLIYLAASIGFTAIGTIFIALSKQI